jgi:deazaflavin-dependent oxidoreductase (nitroreductase family)
MTKPNDLEKLQSSKFIHLTTRGRKSGKPHTVELWFASSNGTVYLSHEGQETDWMKNIQENGRVSFEISNKKFTGKATRLEDGTEAAWAGKLALYEKYYGKATRAVIEDWFSLSKLLVIHPE